MMLRSGATSELLCVISKVIGTHGQHHPTVIKKNWTELITEQYDCLEPRKEQRAIGGVWRKGDGHLRDADTKYYSMPPPVVMKFLNQKNNRKKTCRPLVNVTSYCCHLGVYRCSLEANLSPLMFCINANCNAIINAFHSNVCIICSHSHCFGSLTSVVVIEWGFSWTFLMQFNKNSV